MLAITTAVLCGRKQCVDRMTVTVRQLATNLRGQLHSSPTGRWDDGEWYRVILSSYVCDQQQLAVRAEQHNKSPAA